MRYGESVSQSGRRTMVVCPSCSSSQEIDAPADVDAMRAAGLKLVDGAWQTPCPRCAEAEQARSNLEYEATARASKQLARAGHKCGPIGFWDIPAGEGFEHVGDKRWGFWAVTGDWSEGGFERFRRTARAIVERLNADRGVQLEVNISDEGNQALVHGTVNAVREEG